MRPLAHVPKEARGYGAAGSCLGGTYPARSYISCVGPTALQLAMVIWEVVSDFAALQDCQGSIPARGQKYADHQPAPKKPSVAQKLGVQALEFVVELLFLVYALYVDGRQLLLCLGP